MSRQTAIGRLAIVQPALNVVSIVPDGESTTVELVMAPEAIIVEAERRLALVDLVVEVGRMVAVDVQMDGARRVATRITITGSAEEARALIAAIDSTRPR